jgi:hypothetical protein
LNENNKNYLNNIENLKLKFKQLNDLFMEKEIEVNEKEDLHN